MRDRTVMPTRSRGHATPIEKVSMPQQLTANSAAIATGHPLGAAAGLELLQDGGNAIDAAVAAMIALCVVIPGSVGLAGYGGSAVIYSSRLRRVFAIDFDSRAPAAFREGFVTADRASNYYGARSVTVPAVVAGLELMMREFGTKSWRDVSQPGIRLAEDGFAFDAEHQRHFDRCAPHFDRQSLANLFPGNETPRIGYHWRQPDLGRLLRQLANNGPLSFYDGEIPQTICNYLRARGGILSEKDFGDYRPQFVDALSTTCRDHNLYTPAPPSGGITSLAIIQTMVRLIDSERVDPHSADYFHLLAEAMKLCWQERHTQLGDPDFVNFDVAQMLSDKAATARANQIKTNSRPSPQSAASSPTSSHTANVIASDADCNLVSLTATQGWMYGSHLVVDGLGLVLNHGMSRFDYTPGSPNAPAPCKRMQHNMAPMIGLRNGEPACAFGLPGGPKIVSVTAQLAINSIIFGAAPAASVAAPRLHTDGSEPLLISQHMPTIVVDDLEQRGHIVRRESDMGGPVNVLAIDPAMKTIDIASGEATGAVAGV